MGVVGWVGGWVVGWLDGWLGGVGVGVIFSCRQNLIASRPTGVSPLFLITSSSQLSRGRALIALNVSRNSML